MNKKSKSKNGDFPKKIQKNVLQHENCKWKMKDHFVFDDIRDCNTCLIKGCNQKISGNHYANLERHVRTGHVEEYSKLIVEDEVLLQKQNAKYKKIDNERRKRYIQTKITQEVILFLSIREMKQIIVDLIAEDGVPFRFIESKALRKIFSPIYKCLGLPAYNRHNSVDLIHEYAENMRHRISEACRKQFVNLKIDCVTARERSFLGINLQLCCNYNTKFFTLGIVHLTESHTAQYIKDKVIACLQRYGIGLNQVLSITTDNGANVKKSVQLLREIQQEENAVNATDVLDDLNAEDPEFDVSENIINLIENIKRNGLPNIDINNIENMPIDTSQEFEIENIKCCVHTLQLAVKDAVKSSPNVDNFITKITKIVKTLRTEKARNLLRELNCELNFVLNVATRWMSIYDVFERLIRNKPYVLKMGDFMKEVEIEASDWLMIENLAAALKPCKKATVLLQAEDLTYPQFYKIWMTCVFELSKIDTPFAKKLTQNLKERQLNMMGNIYHSNLFLDPRFKRIYATRENRFKIDEIHEHLSSIWLQILRLKKTNTNDTGDVVEDMDTGTVTAENTTSDVEDDPEPNPFLEFFEANYPEAEFESARNESLRVHDDNREKLLLKEELVSFFEIKGLNPDSNSDQLNEFWSVHKVKFIRCYELWAILRSVPVSEASVERLFSALNYIFNHLRSSMKPDTLNDILLLRCNQN